MIYSISHFKLTIGIYLQSLQSRFHSGNLQLMFYHSSVVLLGGFFMKGCLIRMMRSLFYQTFMIGLSFRKIYRVLVGRFFCLEVYLRPSFRGKGLLLSHLVIVCLRNPLLVQYWSRLAFLYLSKLDYSTCSRWIASLFGYLQLLINPYCYCFLASFILKKRIFRSALFSKYSLIRNLTHSHQFVYF